MKKKRGGVVLFHGSDLFYGSGTAVIYRRIFSELSMEFPVSHVIGPWWSLPSTAEMRQRYAADAGRIAPLFLPGKKFHDVYEKGWRNLGRENRFKIPALAFALHTKRLVKRINPEWLWWSADTMPWSLFILHLMRRTLGNHTPLHLSIFDPPEFWKGNAEAADYYREALLEAVSIDVIGENLKKRIEGESGKPVEIINDFIEYPVIGEEDEGEEVPTAAIAGQIYGTGEIQSFIDTLATVFWKSKIIWYGNKQNYIVADRLRWPGNVLLLKKGEAPRREIVERIKNCSFAYLSMPFDARAFSTYSIPTKLVAYLEAGLPVAYHAPEYSELHALNNRYEIGVNLSLSDHPEELLKRLRSEKPAFAKGIARLIGDRYEKASVLQRVRNILGR